MSAVDSIRSRRKIGGIIREGDLADAILELAEDQATTDGFAHVVAGWAEDAQDRCRKLEKRVEALEDRPAPTWWKPPVFGPVRPREYPRTKLDSEIIKKALEKINRKPAPAPDLEDLIHKHVQIFYDNQTMSISALLRAFAAELGVSDVR